MDFWHKLSHTPKNCFQRSLFTQTFSSERTKSRKYPIHWVRFSILTRLYAVMYCLTLLQALMEDKMKLHNISSVFCCLIIASVLILGCGDDDKIDDNEVVVETYDAGDILNHSSSI